MSDASEVEGRELGAADESGPERLSQFKSNAQVQIGETHWTAASAAVSGAFGV